MYSTLPAIVSILFLSYGLYVTYAVGINRITVAFLILCITTFVWQATWAILFQVETVSAADTLIKIGWLLILFLPTSLYHFLAEISRKTQELHLVYFSYGFSAFLAILLVSTDLVVDGHYDYFFGYYPCAGILLPLHVLQTSIVVTRGLWITYQKQRVVQGEMRLKLRYCVLSVFIYFFAAVDYLCNFGIEFYPPGVIFILVSLGIIALATIKFHIMDDMRILTLSAVHDMRTPLATAAMQTQILNENIPKLISHYQKYTPNSNSHDYIDEKTLQYLKSISPLLTSEIKTINTAVDSLLATATYQHLNKNEFHIFSARNCIENSIKRIPKNKRHNVSIEMTLDHDYNLRGSENFVSFIVINLINNALDAIKKNGDGKITIDAHQDGDKNYIRFRDTGIGIPAHILPHIFDNFFTTKARGINAGIGLAYCKHVMKKFSGDIKCNSEPGQYTCFELSFPRVRN